MSGATCRARRRRPEIRLAAIGCASLLALAGCAEQGPPAPTAFDEDALVGADREVGEAGEVADRDESEVEAALEPWPVAVEVPAIGVDADLVALGLNDDRSMQVPAFGLAGWYAKGPRPGAAGPAVIAAHYDSTDGPDVFYELDALATGDEIHVRREDGSTTTFVVEELEQHPKDELPGDRIWAPSEEPRLTLITCGGVFDRATGHYTDNVIAYAVAAPR